MELQDLGGLGLLQLETFANDLVAAGYESGMITRLNQNFQSNVPQLFIDVDREKAKRLDIPLQTIFDTLQANLGSAYVNDFNLFGRTWRVMVQADQQFRSRISDIQRLEVRTADGLMVPLSTLVTVHETVGPSVINRFNMFPSATITGAPAPGFSEGEAVNEIERISKETPAQFDGVLLVWSVTQQQKESGNVAALDLLAGAHHGLSFPGGAVRELGHPILGIAVRTVCDSRRHHRHAACAASTTTSTLRSASCC